MIDTHVHLLDPARFPFPERTDGYRPTGEELGSLEDLHAVMTAQGVEKAVLVQPSVYGYDNAAIFDAVAAFPERFRGIAVAPAEAAELRALAARPGIAGIRLNITDFKGEAFDATRFEARLKMAGDAGLIVQVLAPCRLLSSFAPQIHGVTSPVIIDHMGSPDIGQGPAGADFRRLMQLSGNPLIHLKLSGAFRYAQEAPPWPSLRLFVSAILESFAPAQLLWGSDWPFLNLRGQPRLQYGATLEWLRETIDAAMLGPMQENAARLFGFKAREAVDG